MRVKIHRMRKLLEELDRVDLLPRERKKRKIHYGQNSPCFGRAIFATVSPTVLQEVKRGLTIAPRLWGVVPMIYTELRHALEECFPGTEFQIQCS